MKVIGEVIIVKLINDENYIGVLTEETEDSFRLVDPLRIQAFYNQRANGFDIGILPWNSFSKMNDVAIDKRHVIYYTLPRDDVLKFYKSNVDKYNSDEPDRTASNFLDEDGEISADLVKAVLEKLSANTSIH